MTWARDPAYPAQLVEKIERYTTTTTTWWLKPWIPFGGVTLLVAPNKTGKTTWILDLLAAQAYGVPFLGQTIPRVPVLYASEQAPASYRQQAEEANLFHPWIPIDLMLRFELLNKTWPQFCAILLERVLETGSEGVILDTWSGLAGFDAEGENDTSLARRHLDYLGPITATGAAVLIAAHQGHASRTMAPRRPGTAARGATGLGDGVDQAIWLQRVPGGREGDPRRSLWAEGRYIETPEQKQICTRLAGCEITDLKVPGTPRTYYKGNADPGTLTKSSDHKDFEPGTPLEDPGRVPGSGHIAKWCYQKDLEKKMSAPPKSETPGESPWVPTTGDHYTMADLTHRWRCSERTVHRRLAAMPGVQRTGSGTRLDPHQYVIPQRPSRTPQEAAEASSSETTTVSTPAGAMAAPAPQGARIVPFTVKE